MALASEEFVHCSHFKYHRFRKANALRSFEISTLLARRMSSLSTGFPLEKPTVEAGRSPWFARCKLGRITHPRWSLGRARLLIPRWRINDESPMGKPVAGRTNGTQPNDFSPRLQRAFQRHEFAPRRELMETRRGMPRARMR